MEKLVAYGLDDVRETREISGSWARAISTRPDVPSEPPERGGPGTATKIDALLLREYVRQRRSVPRPPERRVRRRVHRPPRHGVLRPIVNCDIQSLYPRSC